MSAPIRLRKGALDADAAHRMPRRMRGGSTVATQGESTGGTRPARMDGRIGWSASRHLVGLIVMTAGAGRACAHGLDVGVDGTAPGWTFDGWVVAPLLLSALLFSIGWRRLAGRSRRQGERWRRRAWLFGAGWMVMSLALVSPLHEAGERSFTAHMLEHELLMLVGAPLLVLAEPLVVLLWALPSAWRQHIGQAARHPALAGPWERLTGPFAATAMQAAALWLWHAPALFDRALASDGWHIAQHLSFVVSALLFWTAMLPRAHGSAAGSASRGAAAFCLFATSVISGALGALMAMSQSPWYEGYARLGLAPFGLTPAEDQQLAGLLMWIPGGLVHAGVALVLLRGILTSGTRRADAT